jgi:hypothetical protein
MSQTLKVSLAIGQAVRQDSFACRDEGQREKPLGSQMMVVNVLRERWLSRTSAFLACIETTVRERRSVAPAFWADVDGKYS